MAGSISWDFNFYGTTYNDIYVSENSAVVFEDTNPFYFGAYGDDHFPGEHWVNTIIAPFWSDLFIEFAGSVYFQDFGDHFVIMWKDIDYWGVGSYTFELIGWEAPDSSTNSDVAFLYDFTPFDQLYVIGMQGDASTSTELQHTPGSGITSIPPTGTC